VVKAYLGKSSLVSFWNRRYKEILRLSQIRNKIVHGRVVILAIGKAPGRPVIMGTHLDYFTQGKKRGIRTPRLQLAQVKGMILACILLAQKLIAFYKKIPRYA
jgi:hypothetical protein